MEHPDNTPSFTSRLERSGHWSKDLEFLAANMLIARLRLVMYADQQPATVVRCAMELYGLYASNSGLPSARRDLERLGSER
jgi:hypothetical protein